jgi:hypothetical protein
LKIKWKLKEKTEEFFEEFLELSNNSRPVKGIYMNSPTPSKDQT